MLLHWVDCHRLRAGTRDSDSHSDNHKYAFPDSQPDPGDIDRHSHEYAHLHPNLDFDPHEYRNLHSLIDSLDHTDRYLDVYAFSHSNVDRDPNQYSHANQYCHCNQYPDINHYVSPNNPIA